MGKNYDFNSIINQFKFEGRMCAYDSHLCGHINDTFIVEFECEEGKKSKYVMQRINTNIFTEPEKVMENIENVTMHIKNKLESEDGDSERGVLELIRTTDGNSFYKDSAGNYFRAFKFINGAKTYQKVENPKHMYECGTALGKFQKQLSDFPVDKLHETIKDFHNTKQRYETFLKALKDDKECRAESIRSEIDFLMSRCEEMSKLVNMIDDGLLPIRVTHNDAKFNNIMIDNITEKAVAVIDLDTVMPGLALYDFGDSIRSGATTALEDEKDLSKVNFDFEIFENYTKGYLEEFKDNLTKLEKDNLAFSAKIITMECGMRFLTDYLNGDVYFKIQREGHNLDRARNQFKLVCDMENNMDKMRDIVNKYC